MLFRAGRAKMNTRCFKKQASPVRCPSGRYYELAFRMQTAVPGVLDLKAESAAEPRLNRRPS